MPLSGVVVKIEIGGVRSLTYTGPGSLVPGEGAKELKQTGQRHITRTVPIPSSQVHRASLVFICSPLSARCSVNEGAGNLPATFC